MNKPGLKKIAWLVPFAYLLHLVDEYFTGFPNWFSGLFNVDLSLNDFIIINSIGFIATIIITLLYSFDKVNSFIIASLGTLFFINGIIHIVSSIYTYTYSPGTLTGILIYLPLGYFIIKKIFPMLSELQRIGSIIFSAFLQVIVALIAVSI